MDGVVYDWTPKEPMKHPSGAFEDVIRFLNSNFMIFTKLPVSTFVYTCMYVNAMGKMDTFIIQFTLSFSVHYSVILYRKLTKFVIQEH